MGNRCRMHWFRRSSLLWMAPHLCCRMCLRSRFLKERRLLLRRMRRFPRLKQPWMNPLCRLCLRLRFLT